MASNESPAPPASVTRLMRQYYGSDFPAATWVQVQRLYLPSFVVEIEATAEYPH